MRVLFRADASVDIGTGHLMRCLTLADQLRSEGAQVAFVCRDLSGPMFDLLQARSPLIFRLPAPEAGGVSQQLDAEQTIKAAGQLFPNGIDWLVVDHYRLDAEWERLLRANTRKLMVIDDLADRQHDCDLLLDQNYYRDMKLRYQGLLSEGCITLLGPKYVLLRPEFAAARQALRVRDGTVGRILLFFGGSDFTNQTHKALEAIRRMSLPGIFVDVVVGASNPYRDEIRALCSETPCAECYCQVSNMAELIVAADIAVGAGGSSMWERCYLGLPTITVISADNQQCTTEDVSNFGAIDCIGRSDSLDVHDYVYAIADLIANPERVKKLSQAALAVVPEQTVASVKCAMREMLFLLDSDGVI